MTSFKFPEFTSRIRESYSDFQDAVLYYKDKRFKFQYIPEITLDTDDYITIRGLKADYDDVRDLCYTYRIEYMAYITYDLDGFRCETHLHSIGKLEHLSCEVDAENSNKAVNKFKQAHPNCVDIVEVMQLRLAE